MVSKHFFVSLIFWPSSLRYDSCPFAFIHQVQREEIKTEWKKQGSEGEIEKTRRKGFIEVTAKLAEGERTMGGPEETMGQ